MNFRLLEAFRFVMITGSVSRAAELLHVTQPAVSRAISDLEAKVGFSLFDRVRGRLVATPEGELFFREVAKCFSGIDRLRASAARIRDFGSGFIRIASLAAMGLTLVPHALSQFRRHRPNVTTTLDIVGSGQVRDLVSSGQFDVGLAADEIDLQGLQHQKFTSVSAVCAIPSGHPLAERDIVNPGDLDGEDFVALAPEDLARHRMEDIFHEAGIEPNVVVETSFSMTICRLVLEGVGVALVNPFVVREFLTKGLVVRPFAPDVFFKSVLIMPPGKQKSKIVSEFINCLIESRNTFFDREAV